MHFDFSIFYDTTFFLYQKVATVNNNGSTSYSLTLVKSFAGTVQPVKANGKELNLDAKRDIVKKNVVYTQQLGTTELKIGMILKYNNSNWEVIDFDDDYALNNYVGTYKAIYIQQVSL